MALTTDGAVAPLAPSWIGLGLVALLAGGLGALAVQTGSVGLGVAALGVLPIGLSTVMGGEERVRLTASKLLIETARPLRGLVIGPRRRRVPWKELQGATVAEGGLKITRAGGEPWVVCRGLPAQELQHLADRIARELADPTP